MPTGDQANMAARLRSYLPPWFGDDDTPVLSAVLQGPAALNAFYYDVLQYVSEQTRLGSVSDGWLDLASQDFLGGRVPRRPKQADDVFRLRVKSEILRRRNTRDAIRQICLDLTGEEPDIFEPNRSADIASLGYMGLGTGARLGADNARGEAGTVWVTVYRGEATGLALPGSAGLGTGYAGLGCGYLTLNNRGQTAGNGLVDADIYSALANVHAAGVTVWVRITTQSAESTTPGGRAVLGLFLLGSNVLA